MGVGRSFHRPGTVNKNVLESDFEPLCDGTTRRRSLADLSFLIFFIKNTTRVEEGVPKQKPLGYYIFYDIRS